MNRIKRLSLQQKLILVTSLIVVVMFLIITVLFVLKMENEISNRLNNEIEITTEQLQENLNSKIDNISQLSNLIYTDNDMMSRLTFRYSSPEDYLEFYSYLSQYMGRLLMANSDIDMITFYTNNDTLLPDEQYVRSISEISGKSIYRNVLGKNGIMVFDLAKDLDIDDEFMKENKNLNDEDVCLLRKLDYTGEFNGILSIEINKNAFADFFGKEKEEDIYIIDQNGNTIMHYKNGQDAIKSAEKLSLSKQIKKSKFSSVKKLSNGWRICTFVYQNSLFTNAKKIVVEMIFASILIVIVALAAIWFALIKMSSRLLYVNELIKEAQRENYDVQIEDQPPDEIGNIINSFKNLITRVNYLMKEVYQKELQNKTIELELLRYQINPHFLYNTLSSIASLAKENPNPKLLDMITSLSDLYRISLSRGKSYISVEQEAVITQCYVNIMQNRFDGLVIFKLDFAEETLQGIVPKVLLQPFIENSITHAMVEDRILQITVLSELQGSDLVFTVRDNGAGMESAVVQAVLDEKTKPKGYGITNVNKRIRLLYGEQYGIRIESTINIGTNIIVRIPFRLK